VIAYDDELGILLHRSERPERKRDGDLRAFIQNNEIEDFIHERIRRACLLVTWCTKWAVCETSHLFVIAKACEKFLKDGDHLWCRG